MLATLTSFRSRFVEMDVKISYFHGELEEESYLKQPIGVEVKIVDRVTTQEDG